MFTFLGARNSAKTGVMPAPLFPAKSGVVSSGGVGLASGRAGTPQSVLLASRLTGLALLVVAVMLAFKDPTIRDGAPATCDANPWYTACPHDCFNQGDCRLQDDEHVCVCQDGYQGPDCSAESCPNACNQRGACTRGMCLCDAAWGGPDCSVDRLVLLQDELMDGVPIDMDLEDSCEFLTKADLEKAGGVKIMYWSEATAQMESYEIPEDMAEVLPETCPSRRFTTCAVVGNSGTTLFEQFGREIDAHQMVYRFNQAPTHGFETHVGSKTTFESLNAKFAHQLMRQEPGWRWREPLANYIMFEPLKLQDAYVNIRSNFPQADVLLFGPAFFSKAHQIYDQMQVNLEQQEFGCFTGEKPMSGFYAVLYALATCTHVDLYGFDPWTDAMAHDPSRQFRYHYFDDDQPRTGAHSFDATFYMYKLISMASGKTSLTVHEARLPEPLHEGHVSAMAALQGDEEVEVEEEEEEEQEA